MLKFGCYIRFKTLWEQTNGFKNDVRLASVIYSPNTYPEHINQACMRTFIGQISGLFFNF